MQIELKKNQKKELKKKGERKSEERTKKNKKEIKRNEKKIFSLVLFFLPCKIFDLISSGIPC